jgi:hypothetical protein
MRVLTGTEAGELTPAQVMPTAKHPGFRDHASSAFRPAQEKAAERRRLFAGVLKWGSGPIVDVRRLAHAFSCPHSPTMFLDFFATVSGEILLFSS